MDDKELEVFRSMGGTFGVGWMRDDLGIIHLFANASPGERFRPRAADGGPHWPCDVCDAHGYTENDFNNQIVEALERGPAEVQ